MSKFIRGYTVILRGLGREIGFYDPRMEEMTAEIEVDLDFIP